MNVNGSTALDRQRVVLLHGFTQTSQSWLPLAEQLVRQGDLETILFDLPGHGRSSHVESDLRETAHLVAVAGRATYVGYSMGARLALHVALERPELVERLVLISGTAGLDTESERSERRAADGLLAERAINEGVTNFVASWLRGPLFRTFHATIDDVAARNTSTPEGLASSLRISGTGSQQPLWNELRNLAIPTLIVAGSLDAKFTGLGHRLAATIAEHASFRPIADAGHAAHLEKPTEFLSELRAFLFPWVVA